MKMYIVCSETTARCRSTTLTNGADRRGEIRDCARPAELNQSLRVVRRSECLTSTAPGRPSVRILFLTTQMEKEERVAHCFPIVSSSFSLFLSLSRPSLTLSLHIIHPSALPPSFLVPSFLPCFQQPSIHPYFHPSLS